MLSGRHDKRVARKTRTRYSTSYGGGDGGGDDPDRKRARTPYRCERHIQAKQKQQI
jgi:hypothetical protein